MSPRVMGEGLMMRGGRATVSRRAIGWVGVALVLLGLQGCSCVSYSNHLCIGAEPPKIQHLKETDLRPQVNEKLGCPARFLGFLTTPFKRMGIKGWRDMDIDVVAVGKVKQSAWSTDRFVTMDLELSQITAAGTLVDLQQARYLRAEICERQLGLPRAQWPCPGDHVRITGRLMWDGDGFLEVHPQKRIGLEILERAPGKMLVRGVRRSDQEKGRGSGASRLVEADALYFRQRKTRPPQRASEDVLSKLRETCGVTRDLYFFLGNISSHSQTFTIFGRRSLQAQYARPQLRFCQAMNCIFCGRRAAVNWRLNKWQT